VNEIANGLASSFVIAPTGTLSSQSRASSGGSSPCYACVHPSGKALLVANYDSGDVDLLPILPDGSVQDPRAMDHHRGNGPKPEQTTAHAHCFIPDPSGRFAVAADLGADRVFVYRVNVDDMTMVHVEASDVPLRPGAGPRHLAFHPSLPVLFVANELDSTLATFRWDAERGTLSPLDTCSTLPAGWTGANAVADVHVSSSGRHVYVSNRGHNSIATFTVAASTGVPAIAEVVSCGGDWPRNFALDPAERWLLVANQRSGSVVVFARDETTGRLSTTSHRIELPSPVCLRFGVNG
jgi:6-phosphogluconolactonase